MLDKLFSFLGGGVLNGVQGITKTIWGDKSARDQQAHDEQQSVQAGYQAEFNAPEKQGIFNQFVDGMNRLVRPFYTFGTMGLFVWCAVNPASFAVAMQAMVLIPEMLWYIMATIIAFWFGGRLLENMPKKITAPSLETVKQVLNNQAAIRAADPSTKSDELPNYTDKQFQSDMKDTSKPLSNQAILEWNRRRKLQSNT
jgi:hypothetical protein